MRRIAALCVVTCSLLAVVPPSCKTNPPNSPDASDASVDCLKTPTDSSCVDAASQTVGGLCYWFDGVDPTGTVRNICATIEEIISVAAYIATLRTSPRSIPDAGTCQNLPQTTYCTTSAERALGVLYVSKLRAARLLVDAGR